jgi:hypothetical protein
MKLIDIKEGCILAESLNIDELKSKANDYAKSKGFKQLQGHSNIVMGDKKLNENIHSFFFYKNNQMVMKITH